MEDFAQKEKATLDLRNAIDVGEKDFARESTPVNAMLEVSRMLSRALDLKEVLPRALQVTEYTLNATASSIFLFDEKTGKLRFTVVDGQHAGRLTQMELEPGKGIAGWVMKHGEPQLVPDAYRDKRFDRDFDKMTGFRTRSILCVPLQAGAKRIGVIQVLNRRDGQPFSLQDLALLESVATLIALAVENAREHELRVDAQRLAVIGQTIAGLGHGIKNALQGLECGSYLIDKGLHENPNESMNRAWTLLQKHLHYLSDLVMNMLSYAKRRTPSKIKTDLVELCESVCDMSEGLAVEKGVALEKAFGNYPVIAVADEAGIKRCLHNLIGNAIDACDEKEGKVRVSTGYMPDRNSAFISVKDNGAGIHPDDLPHLFDLFFSTKGNRGTGLGLTVTNKIIEEHGGQLTVASELGEGSEFRIILPEIGSQ